MSNKTDIPLYGLTIDRLVDAASGRRDYKEVGKRLAERFINVFKIHFRTLVVVPTVSVFVAFLVVRILLGQEFIVKAQTIFVEGAVRTCLTEAEPKLRENPVLLHSLLGCGWFMMSMLFSQFLCFCISLLRSAPFPRSLTSRIVSRLVAISSGILSWLCMWGWPTELQWAIAIAVSVICPLFVARLRIPILDHDIRQLLDDVIDSPKVGIKAFGMKKHQLEIHRFAVERRFNAIPKLALVLMSGTSTVFVRCEHIRHTLYNYDLTIDDFQSLCHALRELGYFGETLRPQGFARCF